jgi:hypothetical protein
MTFSGGEIRMGTPDSGTRPWVSINQGTPLGYRIIVINPDDRRFGAEACAAEMEPLLRLLHQFEEIGYEFVRLERTYGT